MGYQALLFCPDEKTARAVSQVLSELDFSVEPCTEPFGAVKRLMAQRFDAVVVDCDNEQNATLLFKSARNSNSNQSSLAVAVVEGQAGVAKAFRIGANLVLTKPINIEQAKGTLRVARGLLRKGSEASKPAVPPTSSAGASVSSAPPAAPRPATPRAGPAVGTMRPTVPPTKPTKAPAPPPVASPSLETANVEVDATLEPGPAASARTPAAGARQAPPATTPGVKPNFPWQPVAKTAPEPMASAMRKAADSAKEGPQPAAKVKPQMSPAAGNRRSTVPVSSGMAAAAPAPAKEPVTPAQVKAPAVAPPPASPKPHIEVAAEVEDIAVVQEPAPKSVVTPDLAPPSFSMGAQDWDEEEGGSNKKALIIIAAVVVLAASAAYLGWRNTNKHSAQPTAAQAATMAPGNPAPNAPSAKPEDSPAPNPQAEPIEAPSASAKPSPASSAPRTSPSNRVPVKESSSPAQAPPASEAEPTPQPLVVKRDAPRQATTPATSQSAESAPPPSPLGVTGGGDTTELANLSSAPVGVPKPSPQVLKISQGVSEGLVLKKVSPKYPAQAIQMRIQGAVQMQATISKDGNIANLKVLTGDSLLARAAQDAVKQWKYKPYYLNGEPVEIQTLITVNFKLPN
jgi:periplasmic protein TonB